MVKDLAGKRVLVLSDNEGLSRAIEFNLKHSHLEVIRLALSSPRQQCPEPSDCAQDVPFDCAQDAPFEGRVSQAEIGNFDLIVVAVSSSTSEPVLALARASLARRIGQVPLLIISDRPFRFGPDDQITHLDFPFDIDGLHGKVEEILQRGSEPTHECALDSPRSARSPDRREGPAACARQGLLTAARDSVPVLGKVS